MRGIRVSLLALVVVAACSSYGGSDAPPGATDGGGGGGGGPPGDPGAPGDASADGAKSSSFCSRLDPAPALCADFDEREPVEFGFGMKKGAVTIDTTNAVSQPASAAFASTSNADPATLLRDINHPLAASMALSFDLYIEPSDDGGAGFLHGFAQLSEDSMTNCRAFLGLDLQGWALTTSFWDAEGGTSLRMALTRYPTVGKWSHVDVHLSSNGGTVRASVDVDGVSALDPVVTNCPSMNGNASLTIGLPSLVNPVDQSGRVRIDNVVFDGQ